MVVALARIDVFKTKIKIELLRSEIISAHLKEHLFCLLFAGLLQQLEHQGLADALSAGFLTHSDGLDVSLVVARDLADARVAKQLLRFIGADRNQVVGVLGNQLGVHGVWIPGVTAKAGVFEHHDLIKICVQGLAN